MEQAFLQLMNGARQGLVIHLDPERPLVIGRKRGDLVIDDPLVSSTHARVVARDGVWVLQDLGSTNGTLVDGKGVREVVLKAGSEIGIGAVRLVLFVGAQEAEHGPDPSLAQLDIAWLLDEELVEIHDRTGSGKGADVIGQDLRIPPGMKAAVEVVAGQDLGEIYRFGRGNIGIGRKQGEVPLTDVEVSRNHAIIEVFGRDMVFLRDLGSTNGTYHNGRRVGVARLADGDTVGCGKTVMKLHLTR